MKVLCIAFFVITFILIILSLCNAAKRGDKLNNFIKEKDTNN